MASYILLLFLFGVSLGDFLHTPENTKPCCKVPPPATVICHNSLIGNFQQDYSELNYPCFINFRLF